MMLLSGTQGIVRHHLERVENRSKRGIAGSLILTVFDRDALYDIKKKALYAAKKTDLSMDNPAGIAPSSGVGAELKTPNYSDQIPPFEGLRLAA